MGEIDSMSGGMTFHMALSVRGALMRWRDRDFEGVFRDDYGRELSAQEAKAFLLSELAKGHEKIPIGKCDNFDWKEGCLGHRREEDL